MEMKSDQDMQAQAATLLKYIWRGIPAEYKSRYRMTIWQQFEDEIKAAAYTSNLASFISRLCGRFQASIGRTDAERAAAEAILRSADDKEMLKLIREQTIYLVLLVRIDNQAERDEWLAEHDKTED